MHAHVANLPPHKPPTPSDSRAQIIFSSTNLDAAPHEFIAGRYTMRLSLRNVALFHQLSPGFLGRTM